MLPSGVLIGRMPYRANEGRALLSRCEIIYKEITVKTVNNSAGPDGIVPILLVFGIYPKMTKNSAPLPFII
jgi:hypothetical protein